MSLWDQTFAIPQWLNGLSEHTVTPWAVPPSTHISLGVTRHLLPRPLVWIASSLGVHCVCVVVFSIFTVYSEQLKLIKRLFGIFPLRDKFSPPLLFFSHYILKPLRTRGAFLFVGVLSGQSKDATSLLYYHVKTLKSTNTPHSLCSNHKPIHVLWFLQLREPSSCYYAAGVV